MENKKKLSTGAIIALIAIAAISVSWLVCDFIFFAGRMVFQIWITVLMTVIATIYVLFAYKIPHGNLMRYLLLLYAISIAGLIAIEGATYPAYLRLNYSAVIILSTYMAGRLDRFKHNIVISALILLCNFVTTYYYIELLTGMGLTMTFVNFMVCIGGIALWLPIAASYIIRFKLHKEAGLIDKD